MQQQFGANRSSAVLVLFKINRACRYFTGILKYTHNSAVQGDMGWKTAGHRQHVHVLRLWLRLMTTCMCTTTVAKVDDNMYVYYDCG